MASRFQGLWGTFLQASAPRVRLGSLNYPSHIHTRRHTNHYQSLHMIGRILQSRQGEGEKERREETWSDQNPTQDKSEESEMPCSLFPSQSPHYHVQLDGGTAQVMLLHCSPLFFIFHWIKHVSLSCCHLASSFFFIQLNGFPSKFVGNWRLKAKALFITILRSFNFTFWHTKEASSAVFPSVELLNSLLPALHGRPWNRSSLRSRRQNKWAPLFSSSSSSFF